MRNSTAPPNLSSRIQCFFCEKIFSFFSESEFHAHANACFDAHYDIPVKNLSHGIPVPSSAPILWTFVGTPDCSSEAEVRQGIIPAATTASFLFPGLMRAKGLPETSVEELSIELELLSKLGCTNKRWQGYARELRLSFHSRAEDIVHSWSVSIARDAVERFRSEVARPDDERLREVLASFESELLTPVTCNIEDVQGRLCRIGQLRLNHPRTATVTFKTLTRKRITFHAELTDPADTRSPFSLMYVFQLKHVYEFVEGCPADSFLLHLQEGGYRQAKVVCPFLTLEAYGACGSDLLLDAMLCSGHERRMAAWMARDGYEMVTEMQCCVPGQPNERVRSLTFQNG